MYYKSIKLVKGQILLITLVVLTILSILTITIVLLNSRDANEVQSNQKYEQAYGSIENKVKELIDNFGQYETPITNLTLSPYNCFVLALRYYACTSSQPSGNINISQEVIVSEERNYDDYKVFKDRSLEIYLNGYKSGIDLFWEKSGLPANEQASLEFILVYKDIAGLFRTKIGVYNPSGVYTSAPASPVPFTYSDNPAYPGNAYAKRINFSSSLDANEIPEKLVIIPRMISANDNVEISISPEVPSLYPNQLRLFKGKAYDSADNESPVVNIVTQIPLHPQTGGLLDYALITENDVTLN